MLDSFNSKGINGEMCGNHKTSFLEFTHSIIRLVSCPTDLAAVGCTKGNQRQFLPTNAPGVTSRGRKGPGTVRVCHGKVNHSLFPF